MSGSLRRSVLGPWPVSTLTSPAPAQTRRHITRHGGDSKPYSHLPQMWVVLCSGRSDDQVQPAACMSLPSPGFAEGPLGTHWPLFLGCPSLSADSSVPLTCHHGPLQDRSPGEAGGHLGEFVPQACRFANKFIIRHPRVGLLPGSLMPSVWPGYALNGSRRGTDAVLHEREQVPCRKEAQMTGSSHDQWGPWPMASDPLHHLPAIQVS